MASFINREVKKENPSQPHGSNSALFREVLTPGPHSLSALALHCLFPHHVPSHPPVTVEDWDFLHPCGVPAPVPWRQSPVIFCLPGPLVSTGLAHQCFSEPRSSLSQNKQSPCLDPIFLLKLCSPSPCPAFYQTTKLLESSKLRFSLSHLTLTFQ